MIRNWIEENGIRTREDMKTRVSEDFKQAQNTRLVDDFGSQNDIRNVRLNFNFNKASLAKRLHKHPIEYETNVSSFLEKVETNPPCNFDDLEAYSRLEILDFEIQGYEPRLIQA